MTTATRLLLLAVPALPAAGQEALTPTGLVFGRQCAGCGKRPARSQAHLAVLSLTAQGHDLDGIDQQHRWAPGTAEVYLAVAVRRLYATGAAHAVDTAVRAGLLTPPERPAAESDLITTVMRTTGQFLADGHTAARIAEIRRVSVHSVAACVRRLLTRLSVTCEAGIVLALHSLGLLDAAHPCPCRRRAKPGQDAPRFLNQRRQKVTCDS